MSNIENQKNKIFELLKTLTKFKDENLKSLPTYCYINDILDNVDVKEKELIDLALTSGYKIYKVSETDSYRSDVIISHPGCLKQTIINDYKDFFEDTPELIEIENQQIQESKNELKDRAKKHKKKQSGKGYFVNPDAGNVEQNVAMFNHAMGNDICAEGVTKANKLKTFIDEYNSANVNDTLYTSKSISRLFDSKAREAGLVYNNDFVCEPYHENHIVKLTNKKIILDNQLGETLAPADYKPEKIGKAYKVFKVKNGKLYPPMVANPGNEDTPIGVWLFADEGEAAGVSKTGRPQVKSTGSGRLAYRPGWHLGDIPLATQFYRTNKETGEKEFPADFVWAECEYAMDIDYQKDAEEQGHMRVDKEGNQYRSDRYQHSLAGLPRLPKDGYYRYRTNPNPDTVPWVITGAMKVNKILNDKEVKAILAKHGIKAPNRQGGELTSITQLGLRESIELDEAIEKHNELNPKLWKDNDLIPEVKNKLEEIVDAFIKSVEEDGVKIKAKDIILLGSNASYNYTNDSDLDVHIIADTKIMDDPSKLLPILYNSYKSIFNKKYDINIYGINVEIYVEDSEIKATSNGIYSLNNGWIKEPVIEDIPEVDIEKDFNEWEDRYFKLIDNPTLKDIEALINDLYILRKNAIIDQGEYSVGNLIFKEFRNLNYLDQLKQLRDELQSKELSLHESIDDEVKMPFGNKYYENIHEVDNFEHYFEAEYNKWINILKENFKALKLDCGKFKDYIHWDTIYIPLLEDKENKHFIEGTITLSKPNSPTWEWFLNINVFITEEVNKPHRTYRMQVSSSSTTTKLTRFSISSEYARNKDHGYVGDYFAGEKKHTKGIYKCVDDIKQTLEKYNLI